MFRRHGLFLVVGLAAVMGCVRLAFWQLDRLAERRSFNRETMNRLARAPVPVESLPADTAGRRFQAVRLKGAFDYDHEVVLTARVRRGSPGVHVFTPLLRPGYDTAVLVNRGWVYSPDGASADLSRWRDLDSVTVHGWTDRFALQESRPVASTANPRGVHRLDYEQLSTRFPYPIAPFTVVWTDSASTDRAQMLPVRQGPPELSEGSHLSYAVQWFLFGAIGLAGMAAFMLKRNEGMRG